MSDFPRSLLEFQRRFPDERACASYLATARWPDGFRCPACAHDKGWELSTKAFTWECASCGKQTSVTAGTVMHGSKLDLTVWFWAAYLMATHSNGMSARQLWRQLGLGSYKSAWLLCAKLRRAMVAPDRSPLQGVVEVDETTIPYRRNDDPPTGGRGRSHDGKILVAGAVEIEGRAPGRVRLAAIADGSAATLHAFIAGQCLCRRHRQDRRLAGLPRCSRRQPRAPRGRIHGGTPRPAMDASPLRQPQTLGARRLPRPASG